MVITSTQARDLYQVSRRQTPEDKKNRVFAVEKNVLEGVLGENWEKCLERRGNLIRAQSWKNEDNKHWVFLDADELGRMRQNNDDVSLDAGLVAAICTWSKGAPSALRMLRNLRREPGATYYCPQNIIEHQIGKDWEKKFDQAGLEYEEQPSDKGSIIDMDAAKLLELTEERLERRIEQEKTGRGRRW